MSEIGKRRLSMFRLSGVLASFRFEWKRNLSTARLATVVGLPLFPAAMVILLVFGIRADMTDAHGWVPVLTLFYMIPGVVCVLGLLMWATPVVSSELEGRTWGYIAVRPNGVVSVVIGKYLNAVGWTIISSWLGVLLCVLIIQPREFIQLFVVLAALSAISAMSYGAIYVFLGAIFLRRAMVVAVAYTLAMEVLVSMVPATINQFTVQFRLRSLLMDWLALRPVPPNAELFFASGPWWLQVLILTLGSAVLLVASCVIVWQRELVKPDES